MDPNFSEEHRLYIETHPDVATEGFTTTDEHANGADYYWICADCYADFADRFGWRVA